jgi:histidinol-phosphate aminotransferase
MIQPKKHIKGLFRMPVEFERRIGNVVRLDRNERTTSFPVEHLNKILNSITPEEVVAYPELEPFYSRIKMWLKVEREEVLLASGSDTSIKAVYEVYVDKGDEVVMLSPTYGMYAVYCKMFGAIAREIFYDEDFSLPVDRVLAGINQKTKLIVLANPNHTGTVIKEESLIEIIKSAESNNALVLIDEAYYHFYDGTMLPYIKKYDNLIIIRTFSKAFGIAPLRIGYTIADKSVISELYKVKLTHEITGVAAKIGSYMLDNPEIMNNYVNDVNNGKLVLYRELSELGCEVMESHANFVFFKIPIGVDVKQVLSELQEKNIYIKGPFENSPFQEQLRVTVGSEEQMQMFCDEVREIFKS